MTLLLGAQGSATPPHRWSPHDALSGNPERQPESGLRSDELNQPSMYVTVPSKTFS
jgi:hypothetical protein